MSLGKTYKQHTLVETSETLGRVAIKLLMMLTNGSTTLDY